MTRHTFRRIALLGSLDRTQTGSGVMLEERGRAARQLQLDCREPTPGENERTPVSEDLTALVTIFCYLGLTGTLYMTGVVWFAQLVHYPLLDRGTAEDYPAFVVAYQRRTLWVVVPGLTCEILGTLGLVWSWPSLQAWVGLGLLLAIWALTCTILIPRHLLLKRRYSSEDHRVLVRYNLPRSLLWTLRAGVMIWTALTLPAGVQ